MYTIKCNNKRYNRKTYSTYEAARKYALKLVRKFGATTMKRIKTATGMKLVSKYPALRDYGFSIAKVS